jgi:hypothetical protein
MDGHQSGLRMSVNENDGDLMGSDFTMETYRRIAQLATSFAPASYREIPWEENFILFRHDVDVSLNRALALANIDAELGLRSTFFIDPLGQYYSAFEPDQRKILFEILDLGHDIGLHFDSSRHPIDTERNLEEALKFESKVLAKAVAEPLAFSFHNPSEVDLAFKKDSYAGIPNAYSEKLFTQAVYTSDSNGYWRHTPIFDVLFESLGIKPVQVLTHPEWWLDQQMSPRSRIHRAVYGRSQNVMGSYDSLLAAHGRVNVSGMPSSFLSLVSLTSSRFQTIDTLWNTGSYETLFVELWVVRESQINKLAQAHLRKVWGVPEKELNAFFASHRERIDGRQLFELVFERSWLAAGGFGEIEHIRWIQVRNNLVQAVGSLESTEIVEGLHHLSDSITKVAKWGLESALKYDGLAHLESIGIQTFRSAEDSLVEILVENIDPIAFDIMPFNKKKWNDLKNQISQNQAEDE